MSTRGSLVYWNIGRNTLHLYDETADHGTSQDTWFKPYLEIDIGRSNPDGTIMWYKTLMDRKVPLWIVKILTTIDRFGRKFVKV